MNCYYNFEIYTCNKKTGETGWDIHYVDVKAETRAQARENIKKYPYFDCVILFNHKTTIDETADFLQTSNDTIINRITL